MAYTEKFGERFKCKSEFCPMEQISSEMQCQFGNGMTCNQ